jgi:uncharacterized membrane protein YwaF
VLPLDVVFGWNYGFVASARPEQPSIVDYLGPWPGRVAVITGLGLTLLAALVVPWTVGRSWLREHGRSRPRSRRRRPKFARSAAWHP